MAFIRKRGNSHQLIETYREDGKVKQRVLANLGPFDNIEEAARKHPDKFRHLLPGASDTTRSVETAESSAGTTSRVRLSWCCARSRSTPTP